MIKIAICDDNQDICRDLENILRQIENLYQYDFEIKVFYSLQSLNEYFYGDDIDFDIIFLDIEFPDEMNGIYLGNKIRNDFFKETIKIIYISSFEQYGKDLFQVRPFDFMIKPLNFIKIEKTINNIIKIITKQNKPFEYSIEGTKYTIDLYKILYFKSIARKIEIITRKTMPYNTFYGKISDTHKQLSQSDFFFCHKSYLINYHNIAEFQYKEITMINGDKLNISQYFRKDVREMRNKKMGEK